MRKRIAGIVSLILLFAVITGVQAIRTMDDIKSHNKAGVKGSMSAHTGAAADAGGLRVSNATSTATEAGMSDALSEERPTRIALAGGAAGSGVLVKDSKAKTSRGNAGSNPNFKKTYYSKKAIVLTYHHISHENFSGITITPERFESDLKMLREKGFNVISFNAMTLALEGGARLPDNAVVITFDDGIGSVYKYAFPLLKKYSVPATSFLVTSRNESWQEFTTPDSPLSPDEIAQMHRSGLVDFQSHTHQSHEKVYINSKLKKGAKLTNRIYDRATGTYESNSEYEDRVMKDLTTSRELILEYTGTEPTALCFPFGVYDKQVLELAAKCGFKYFVTTHNGANYENSKNTKIYRIRAGDADKSTDDVFHGILDAAR